MISLFLHHYQSKQVHICTTTFTHTHGHARTNTHTYTHMHEEQITRNNIIRFENHQKKWKIKIRKKKIKIRKSQNKNQKKINKIRKNLNTSIKIYINKKTEEEKYKKNKCACHDLHFFILDTPDRQDWRNRLHKLNSPVKNNFWIGLTIYIYFWFSKICQDF